MELKSKLSAKDILGNVLEIVKTLDIDQTVDAYSVAGTCDGYETGVSTYGEWIRFCGDVVGINYLSGEEKRAPAVHMPSVLEKVLMSGIADNAEVVGSKSTKTSTYYKLANRIEFAYKVSLTRNKDNDDNSVSYQYNVSPLTAVAPNDNLAHLTALLPPAPKKPDALEAKAEQKAGKKS